MRVCLCACGKVQEKNFLFLVLKKERPDQTERDNLNRFEMRKKQKGKKNDRIKHDRKERIETEEINTPTHIDREILY